MKVIKCKRFSVPTFRCRFVRFCHQRFRKVLKEVVSGKSPSSDAVLGGLSSCTEQRGELPWTGRGMAACRMTPMAARAPASESLSATWPGSPSPRCARARAHTNPRRSAAPAPTSARRPCGHAAAQPGGPAGRAGAAGALRPVRGDPARRGLHGALRCA